jgi:steroid delta-isomerase-like uncharacterized protein
MIMQETDIKIILNQALADLNNKHNRTPYFDLYDDTSLVTHGLPPHLPSNKEGLKTFYTDLWQAFPDFNLVVDHLIVEGNTAAFRFTMTGTHKGKFMGIPPSNKPIRIEGLSIFAFHDSKCVERWELIDMLSIMEQLNVRQQISAIMNGILEFAEVKTNKELEEKIKGFFRRHHQ